MYGQIQKLRVEESPMDFYDTQVLYSLNYMKKAILKIVHLLVICMSVDLSGLLCILELSKHIHVIQLKCKMFANEVICMEQISR